MSDVYSRYDESVARARKNYRRPIWDTTVRKGSERWYHNRLILKHVLQINMVIRAEMPISDNMLGRFSRKDWEVHVRYPAIYRPMMDKDEENRGLSLGNWVKLKGYHL